MSRCFFHWCPGENSCGKKVIFLHGKGFQCMVCKKWFTKEELENFKNGVNEEDLYEEVMSGGLGEKVLDEKLRKVAYMNVYRKKHKSGV